MLDPVFLETMVGHARVSHFAASHALPPRLAGASHRPPPNTTTVLLLVGHEAVRKHHLEKNPTPS